MPCCGSPALSYTPSFAQPKAELTVGETGLTLVRYVGTDDRPQFGRVTGTYYPFNNQPILYADVRDVPFLKEVIRAE